MRAVASPQNLVIAAGCGLSAAAVYAGLPEQIPPSWTMSGRGAIWLGTPMVAFLLPAAVLITDVLLRGLYGSSLCDEAEASSALAIYDAIMLRFMVFVMAVHVTVLAALLGLLSGRPWAGRIVPVMLGVTMISIGNLLPRTRPNLAIGIRTAHTLADRTLWMRTHRAVGYLLVASGIVVALAALIVPPPAGPGMILVVGPLTILGTCVLVWQSTRHAKA